MDIFSFFTQFYAFLYALVFNVLIFLYTNLWSNMLLAIIALALLYKGITWPITKLQKSSAESTQDQQKKLKELQEKYKDDQETLLKEQLKLQGSQLKGCLGCFGLILIFPLIFSVSNVLRDISNEGWYSYNSVVWSEEYKKQEDYYKATIAPVIGRNELTINLNLDGEVSTKKILFWVYKSGDEDMKSTLTSEKTAALKDNSSAQSQLDLAHGVIYIGDKTHGYSSMFMKNFKDGWVIEESKAKELAVYFRFINKYSKTTYSATLNGVEIADAKYSETGGDMINLKYWGVDITKVALDFTDMTVQHEGFWGSFQNIFDSLVNVVKILFTWQGLPYVVLAVLVSTTQYMSMVLSTPTKKEEVEEEKKIIEGEIIEEKLSAKKKKGQKAKEIQDEIAKKEGNEQKDSEEFAIMMQNATKQMLPMMSVMMFFTSLGFLGGSTILPAALSIFWTIQNIFVIMTSLSKKVKIVK